MWVKVCIYGLAKPMTCQHLLPRWTDGLLYLCSLWWAKLSAQGTMDGGIVYVGRQGLWHWLVTGIRKIWLVVPWRADAEGCGEHEAEGGICKVTEDHLCWESQVKLEETGVSGLFLQPLRTRFSKEGKMIKCWNQ